VISGSPSIFAMDLFLDAVAVSMLSFFAWGWPDGFWSSRLR